MGREVSEGGARRRRRWVWVMLAVLVVGVGGAAGIVASKRSLRWRARLVWARFAHDQFPEIPTRDFLHWLRADSAVDLFPLLEKPNVRAAIRNEFIEPEDIKHGARVFATNCARCHGDAGGGNAGPSLVNAIGSLSDWNYFATVKWGKRGTAMLPAPITDGEIWQTNTFVRSLVRKATSARPVLDVTSDLIARGESTPETWLTYAGGYA